MKAMVRSGYGGPDALHLVDYVRGRPWVARLATGVRAPKAKIPGVDVAGEVVAVGPAARRFEEGERVFADLTDVGSGAWAEFVAAPESALTSLPETVPFEIAATAPSSGVFGIQGVRGKRPVRTGDRVLVNGASGNVGPFALQVAKADGAVVTGTCRTDKMDMVRELGADDVIDYTVEDSRNSDARYDLIVDIACHGGVAGVRQHLTRGGGYVVIGGNGRGYVEAATVGTLLTLTTTKRMGILNWKVNDAHDMQTIADLLESGALRPHIDRTYPLAEVSEAMRRLESGDAKGKLVIRMA